MFVLHFFRTLPTIFLILFILNSTFCSSSSNFPVLSLNTSQSFSVSTSGTLTFRIKGDPSSIIGTFYISTKRLNPEISPALLLISNQNCENEGDTAYSETLPSKQVFYSGDSFGVSFNLNASVDQCFNVRSISGTRSETANYSILVTFTPISTIFQLNKPSSFELAPDSEKEFACDLSDKKDKKVEMILISISSGEDYFELREFEEFCLKTLLPGSWLCYIKDTRMIPKFSLYNRGPHRSHQITISEIWTQRVEPDIEGVMLPSVPGLGTFFTVNLPSSGVLKIQATSSDNKRLPILTSISLPSLLTTVYHRKERLLSLDSEINKREFAMIMNSQPDTEWYYFVPEKENSHFLISSSFQKVAPIEIDTPTIFYIDPKVHEYQLVQVKLDVGRFFEKYQVTLFSESNTSISLYYNQYSFGLECISGQSKSSVCQGGNLVSSSSAEELSLIFEAEPLNSVAHLTIKVSKRGFYTLEVTKSNSRSTLRTLLFMSSLVNFVICFLWYVYKLKNKKPTLSNLEEHSFHFEYLERMDHALQFHPDLEMNGVSNDASTRNVEFLPSLIGMVEKLKRQEKKVNKRKQAIESRRFGDMKNKNDNEDKDEKTCDICYEKRKIVTFEPCAHTCACIICAIIIAQTSANCPLCRAKISEIKVSDSNQATEKRENGEVERNE